MSRPFHMSDHPDLAIALGIDRDREAAITAIVAPLVEVHDTLPACLNAAYAAMEYSDPEWHFVLILVAASYGVARGRAEVLAEIEAAQSDYRANLGGAPRIIN